MGTGAPISSFPRKGGTQSPGRVLQLRQRVIRGRPVCAAGETEVLARVSLQARATAALVFCERPADRAARGCGYP